VAATTSDHGQGNAPRIVENTSGDRGVTAAACVCATVLLAGEDTVADTAASPRDRRQMVFDYECMREYTREDAHVALTSSVVALGKGRAREDECREDGGIEHLVEVFRFALVSARLLGPCFYSSGTH
jgi:hypothetical protein